MHLMKAGDLQKHERSLDIQQSREKLTMQMIRKAMQQLPMEMTAKHVICLLRDKKRGKKKQSMENM